MKGQKISRYLSLTIVVSFSIFWVMSTGGKENGVLLVAVALSLFPLALIWFPEEFGEMTGYIGRGKINTKTPPVLVAIGGWFMLVGFPAILYLIE